MIQIDKRKYISETDILDKNTRIDLIIDMLDLIMSKNCEPKLVVKNISQQKSIEEEKLIRLLPDVIQRKII